MLDFNLAFSYLRCIHIHESKEFAFLTACDFLPSRFSLYVLFASWWCELRYVFEAPEASVLAEVRLEETAAGSETMTAPSVDRPLSTGPVAGSIQASPQSHAASPVPASGDLYASTGAAARV